MPSSKRSAVQTPKVKVWFEIDGQYSFGHGICRILQAIEDTGSIKGASERLGKSYRYIWGRIKEAEAVLQTELVTSQVGGREPRRSELTPKAKHLVTNFVALRERIRQVVHEEFRERFQDG